MTVVALVAGAALAFSAPALAAGISGSVSLDPPLGAPVNLTTQGPIDWAVWGSANGGTSTSLAPDTRKLGASAISDLENIDPAPTVPLRGLGQFTPPAASPPFRFAWSDGSGPLRDSNVAAGIQHDGEQTQTSTLGHGFGFTVPASTTPMTLKVYVATNRADGTLTASLSDGSAPDFVDVLPQATDLRSAVYTITYSSAAPKAELHVTWVESAESCSTTFYCDNAAIYAAALTRTFVVNTANDHNDEVCNEADCSLREAIDAANTPAADGIAGGTIQFALPAGASRIFLGGALPTITAPVAIDGDSQPLTSQNTGELAAGDNATPLVELSPGNFSGDGVTFAAGADGSSVRGLILDASFDRSVVVQGANAVTVAGNFIGVDATGLVGTGFGTSSSGVYVGGSAGSTVGGIEVADRNLVAGVSLSQSGVDLDGSTGTLVQGNYIGTDRTGLAAVPNSDGVAIFGGATNNLVSGNVIAGNYGSGVSVQGSDSVGNTIAANLIGVGADGTTPLGNGNGIYDENSGQITIGGPLGGNTVADSSSYGIQLLGGQTAPTVAGNVVTGNGGSGIYVEGGEGGGPSGFAITGNRVAGNAEIGIYLSFVDSSAARSTVSGNTVGLDATGAVADANGGDGIRIESSGGIDVGGTAVADRNVVSGNGGHGIHLIGNTGEAHNTVEGNYVGVNAAGTAAVPNTIDGIAVDGSNGNTIGGTAPGAGNLSSGNTDMGISLFSGSSGNVVQGNRAGTNAAGTSPGIPNGFEGIRIDDAPGNTIGAGPTGGVPAGAGNEVAYNGRTGIAVYPGSTADSIRGNQVHDNGELGIDLSLTVASSGAHADGVTPNDANDADTGPNNLQNFPVLSGALYDGASTEITGTLAGAAGTYAIDFYASPTCDASGNGEGAVWIGWGTAVVGASPATIDTGAGITGPVSAGDAITATATDGNGNTSEFSACVIATGAMPKAGLGLTADEASVPAGAATVPLSSVPAGVLGQFAFAPVPNSPVPNSPVGASPVPNSPVPNSPVPNSPVPNSPVPNSPVANSGFDGIAATDLSKILLSSIPIDWSTIFTGSDVHANVPVTGLTLADVYADPPALAKFEQLKLGQLQLQSSLLRGVRLESILFGGTKLEYIPPYTQSGWCAAVAPASCSGIDRTKTTVLGLDVAGLLNDTLLGDLGKVTVGQITDPVAPVPNSPVPNSPVPNSPVPNSPVPNSALSLTAIGGVVIGTLYDPSLVVDCTKFTSTAVCLTKTLADAAALNAIKPSATFAEILAPKTTGGPSPLANTNFNEFAIGLVGLENLPWEAWPIDGFQAFAGTGDVVHYHLTAPLPCGTAYSLRVTLPHGFLVKPGTSSIVVGTGKRQAVGDPAQDAATGATWDTTHQGLPQATGCSGAGTQPAGLDFQALAGFRLGLQTSTARLIVGTTTSAAVAQAPLTVTQNNEPDDTPATAPAIQPNTLGIGHIASSSDLDWRSISTAGLPAGTKIIVYLRPPAGTDLDLYLTKPGSLSLLSSPVPNSPVPNSPVPNSPVPNSPVPNSGDTLNRTSDNPQPEGLQDAPVPNSALASYGITRGDGVEVAAVTLSGTESGPVGALVDGYNGDHSADPYTLRVQIVKPPQLPACPARTFASPSATVGTLPASIPADTQTLFLLNSEATGRTYGQAAADGLKARLDTFVAAHPELKAAVLSVDGDPAVRAAKAAWDAAPCSIPAANDVVRKINAVVARYRAQATVGGVESVKNIVIVGGDELMPMARVADGTTDANESTASGDLLFTTQGGTRANALFASEFLGNVLTDDAYAAGSTIPWFGGELDLPSVAVGRLVETPAEIEKQLDAYDASDGVLTPGLNDGVLTPTDGVVTGYDFMTDEATQIQSELAGRLTGLFSPFIGGNWLNTDIKPYYDNSLHRGGILSVNGHYNHWELAPAAPQPIVKSGLLDSTALPNQTLPTQLQNAILFTMGCHAGLNVSDTFPFDTGKEQQLRDWAQGLAQNGAGVYVANTGYGYGDYDAIALSEQLMTMFAHNLAADGTIGRKLALAKQQFFGTIGIADPYAAKALQEATFYGLPFYAVGSRTEAPDAPLVTTGPTVVSNVAAASFSWPSDFGTALQRHDTSRGTYWSTGTSGVEYVDGRPIEPRADHEVTASGLTAHGVLIDSLTTHDTAVDPLIASPMIDNSAHEPELKVTNSTFPATFASIGHWNAFGKRHDELVFVPGQTRDGAVQRLVDTAGLHVLYSTSSDVTPPLFTQVGSIVEGGTATLFAHVADPSGVPLVRAFFTQGSASWTFVDLARQGTSDLYIGTALGITVPRIEAAFEAEDGAGNVGFTTDKGHLFLSLTGDHTGPEVTVAAPIENGALAKNQVVPASFACSDPGGVVSCSGTTPNGANIDTSTYGTHAFTVTATDVSGNTTIVTVEYTVGYRFSGFFQPVDDPPVLNVAKAGSSIALKFSLGGDQGLAILASGSPSTSAIGCDNAAPTDDVTVDPTDTAGKSGLSYSAGDGQYTYVWKTAKSWSGTCRRLTVTLTDGTAHSANFKFK